MTDFECFWPLTMTLGESPFWGGRRQALFWVDIIGARIHRLDPERRAHSVVQLDETIGCIARHRDGGSSPACAPAYGSSATPVKNSANWRKTPTTPPTIASTTTAATPAAACGSAP